MNSIVLHISFEDADFYSSFLGMTVDRKVSIGELSFFSDACNAYSEIYALTTYDSATVVRV